MWRIVVASIVVCLLSVQGGCKDRPKVRSGGTGSQEISSDTQNSMIGFIKTHTLANFPKKTIGEALDGYVYLRDKTWSAQQVDREYLSVTFTGWFVEGTPGKNAGKSDASRKGFEAVFVVNPDGSFYLFSVSMLEARSDGGTYSVQLPGSDDILGKIYAGERIVP